MHSVPCHYLYWPASQHLLLLLSPVSITVACSLSSWTLATCKLHATGSCWSRCMMQVLCAVGLHCYPVPPHGRPASLVTRYTPAGRAAGYRHRIWPLWYGHDLSTLYLDWLQYVCGLPESAEIIIAAVTLSLGLLALVEDNSGGRYCPPGQPYIDYARISSTRNLWLSTCAYTVDS